MSTNLQATETNPANRTSMDVLGIMELIPHRPPFLMIDAVKNITINEHFFAGHFPARPVLPGVLIIESMAQTAAVLVVESLGPDSRGKLVYFMTIDDARFRKPVVPGDQLRLEVKVLRNRGPVWKFSSEAKVDGQTVAEATYSAMILDD